jgi:hypothetical protein
LGKVKVQAKDLQQLSTLVDENNKLQQQLSDVETKTRGIYLYHIFNVWMVFEN